MLDVLEQGRLGRDQAAGGDEALVPAGIEPGRGRGQRLVQLAEDGYVAGLLAGAVIFAAGAVVAICTVNARISAAEAAAR